MKYLSAFFLFCGVLVALPQPIEQAINKSAIPRNDISIYIENLRSGKTIASHHASRTRSPASVIKVFTTYASLLKFGFDYRFPTEFYTRGRLGGGILQGDLIVKGYGDPSLSDEEIPSIVSQIKRKGIRHITGNIIIDRSYFKVGTQNSSNFDKNRHSPYNAMPDALMFNERVSTIIVNPRRKSVYRQSPDYSYKLHNHVKFVNASCRGKYSWVGAKVLSGPALKVAGSISKHCGEKKVEKLVVKPYKSFYNVLKNKLKGAGVKVGGTLKVHTLPKGSKKLFTHYSKPLGNIVAKTNKKSNNVYARHLQLYTGAKVYGAPASLYRGRKAVERILENAGAMGSGSFYLDNGSGLSRNAKLNAKMMHTLLKDAYKTYGSQWLHTLAIGGKDGTIKKRFAGSAAHGKAFMKTGTLRGVKNIAGYVKSRDGSLYSVSILVNTKKSRWKAAKLQNDIIEWLAGSGQKGGSSFNLFSNVKEKKKEIQQLSVHKPMQSNHNYFVQAGVFSSLPSQSVLKKLERFGYAHKIVRSGGLYKLLVGGFDSKKSAQKALQSVRVHFDIGAFIVKL